MSTVIRIRRRVTVTLLCVAAMVASTTVATAPASATTSFKSIVCGGVKHGTGWQTSPTGGYTGEGCGPGIDYVATPTSATSTYDFGTVQAGIYLLIFQAWIPNVHATAAMDYQLFCNGNPVRYLPDGTLVDQFVNQAPISGWVTLFRPDVPVDLPTCDWTIKAWTGMVSHAEMGLDAVRSHI